LAFKVSYALNKRRLRCIGFEDLMLRVDDLLVEVDGFGLNLGHRMKAYEALRNIASRAKACDSGANGSHVHD
jgi:hypothetical protein